MAATRYACCLLLLLVQLVLQTTSFPVKHVTVGSKDGYEFECHHTAAPGVIPKSLDVWWFNKGIMQHVASVKNGVTWKDPSFPGTNVIGLQLPSLSLLSMKMVRPTANQLGSYICTLNYEDSIGEQEAAVVGFANYGPSH